jgi:8-oxo-dGTP pyrophosphatase MutT (NUDIX family)
MVREISAGGVVVRNREGEWWMAAIEPPKDESSVKPAVPDPSKRAARSKPKPVLCLPKGLVNPGEKALEAALREVREETGITAVPVIKLGDIKYVYVRSWGDGERVFKIVSFYLLRYESGRIDNIEEAMRIEVARARWVRLEDAPKLLAYKGEKQMARRALEYVDTHAEL